MGSYEVYNPQQKQRSYKRKLISGSAKNILRRFREEDEEYDRYSLTQSNLTSCRSSWSNISDLLSVKSLNFPQECFQSDVFHFNSHISETPILHSKKKSKIDAEASIITEYDDEEGLQYDIENSILVAEEKMRDSLEVALLEKIHKFKTESSTLHKKKDQMALVRQYKIISTCTSISNSQANRTADLCVKMLHFPQLPQRIGQQDYFLLLTCGTSVQTSNITKSTTNYITFYEEFVFEGCTLNFCIHVELYAVKLTAKINSIMKKVPVMEKLVKWYKSRRSSDLIEPSSFKLVDRFDLTREDIFYDDSVGSIRTKTVHNQNARMPKAYKFALEIQDVYVHSEKSGPLSYCMEAVWKKLHCELDRTFLRIFEHGMCVTSLDLRYVTYARIGEDKTMVIMSVSPSSDREENKARLKSRDNFVVTTHEFRARNYDYLRLWCDAINDVVESLDCWRSTFLYRDELLQLNM